MNVKRVSNVSKINFGVSFKAKKLPKPIDDDLYTIEKKYKYIMVKNKSMYGAPFVQEPVFDCYLVKTGKNQYIRTDEIGDDIIEQLVIRPKRLAQKLDGYGRMLSKVEDFLIRKDRIAEAIAIRQAHPDAGKSAVLPNYLVKKGRLNEAQQVMDIGDESFHDIRMSSILNEYGINKDGDVLNTELIEPENNADKYKAQIAEAEANADKKYEQVSARAEKAIHEFDDSLPVIGKNRPLKAILTLGISEAIRYNKKTKLKRYYCDEIASNKREKISDIKYEAKEDANRYSEKMKQYDENKKKTELVAKTKDSIKKDLKTGLVAKLTQLNKGKAAAVPNCVMFYGEQPYLTQEFAKWIAEASDSDFAMVRSDINNGKMENDISEALKTSQANWEETKKRSIIFVEGMEKLISTKEGSTEDIAKVKELMKTANENHATIVFHSCNPVDIEPSALTSNRVGLKINVPVKYSDTKIEF